MSYIIHFLATIPILKSIYPMYGSRTNDYNLNAASLGGKVLATDTIHGPYALPGFVFKQAMILGFV